MKSILDSRTAQKSANENNLVFGPAVSEEDFQLIQNHLALNCFKWDIQVGDTATLFRQPLFIHPETVHQLQHKAEALAAELMKAEQELLFRPELHSVLGLPEQSQAILRNARIYGSTPSAVRTLRFDFHYTTEGWRISEVNSDVPGGYTEASNFTERMAQLYPHAKAADNPARRWSEAMLETVGPKSKVALLSAPGFLEDQQVTAFLASQLHPFGIETFFPHHPEQISWKSGHASVVANSKQVVVDAIVRFYQGEWLMRFPNYSGWNLLFAEGKTPVGNPGIAILTESKRFPLTWKSLSNKMDEWRALLPESCDPAQDGWQNSNDWVLKEAFSNTGDAVYCRDWMPSREWLKLCTVVRKYPGRWIVQRKFEAVPIPSALGAVHPCIGVYTINGKAAGIYARASLQPVIDYAAMDVAVLVSEKSPC